MSNKKEGKLDKVLLEHVQKVKNDWDNKRNGGDIAVVMDPITNTYLIVTKLEVEDNMVKVWTGDYNGETPEFVIVNPPVKYSLNGKVHEDPMTAITISIIGAKK